MANTENATKQEKQEMSRDMLIEKLTLLEEKARRYDRHVMDLLALIATLLNRYANLYDNGEKTNSSSAETSQGNKTKQPYEKN